MNDMQMARGAVEGGWNLSLGEPVLLQQHLPIPKNSRLTGPYTYPTMDGDPRLMEELRRLHPEGEIVVTVGAKQALAACFYAYKKLGYVGVYHKPPYWPSYPTLTRMAGLLFNEDTPSELTVEVNTTPNNPDGKTSGRGCHVWDASYTSAAYGWEPHKGPNSPLGPWSCQVKVMSASKLLGLSGARVGWLVTQDCDLAAHAREYVELTTSGVSIPAQRIVAIALGNLRESESESNTYLLDIRCDIAKNCNEFERVIRPFVAQSCGTESHGVGMFAFFQIKPEHLDKFKAALIAAKVTMVTGEACGMDEPGWYRMNLAQEVKYTAKALTTLAKELK
jgi:aspartate/methionine/tyrosine aminotransferase